MKPWWIRSHLFAYGIGPGTGLLAAYGVDTNTSYDPSGVFKVYLACDEQIAREEMARCGLLVLEATEKYYFSGGYVTYLTVQMAPTS